MLGSTESVEMLPHGHDVNYELKGNTTRFGERDEKNLLITFPIIKL